MSIEIMACRYEFLKLAIQGYERTGVLLIGYDGSQLIPFSIADDIGLSCIIPKLVTRFNISLDQALNIFFYGMIMSTVFLGCLGFFLLYRSILPRTLAIISLVALCTLTRNTNVYFTYIASVISIVPLFLYFMRNKKVTNLFILFLFLTGLFLGAAHYVRAYSSLAVVIFMLVYLFWGIACSLRKKSYLISSLIIGMALSSGYFTYAYHSYTKFVEQHIPEKKAGLKNHVFWHSVYLGFSFLRNDALGIKWDDAYAEDKVASMAPEVLPGSEEYESILKNEVISLLKNELHFVLKTIFAKLGVLFMYLLFFAHVGLIAAYLYPKKYIEELTFWLALFVSSWFGILVLPYQAYILGFIAFAVLYGIVSINHALEQVNVKRGK